MRKPDSINPELIRALGRRIRARREATGLTAMTFAEANDWDRNLWGRIERGQQNVSISTLAKVASSLSIAMSGLLAGIEDDLASGTGADGGT